MKMQISNISEDAIELTDSSLEAVNGGFGGGYGYVSSGNGSFANSYGTGSYGGVVSSGGGGGSHAGFGGAYNASQSGSAYGSGLGISVSNGVGWAGGAGF